MQMNGGKHVKTIEEKLTILIKVAKELNANNITWAVGASLLLYFKGITKEFADIDIMVAENDAERVKEILLSFGELYPKDSNEQYKTKDFMEFSIEGIDFDVMAGFAIVNNDIEHYFPLHKKDIKDYIEIKGTTIPLQSIEEWLTFYKLMNRTEKVKIINDYLGN